MIKGFLIVLMLMPAVPVQTQITAVTTWLMPG